MEKNINIKNVIKKRINDSFKPYLLEIVDESKYHKNHLKSRSMETHFSVTIVSDIFCGRSKLSRHRMVYNLMLDLISKKLHALQINTYTRDEYLKK